MLFTLGALAISSSPAFAHGDMTEPAPEPAPVSREMMQRQGKSLGTLHVEVAVPEEAELGDTIEIRATVTGPRDAPVPHSMVTFQSDASWGELAGHMVIGTAATDDSGVATIPYEVRRSGEVTVDAVAMSPGYAQGESEETSVDVHGNRQLYWPSVGIRIPGLNFWVLASVVGTVWALYFVVGMRIVAIARPRAALAAGEGPSMPARRQFLAKALPLGASASIASFGAVLVTLIARSPRTHSNLAKFSPNTPYKRTPFARIGTQMEMRAMPPPLERTVSFREEILPIFMESAGPHVVMPENSPPPGGLRLDSYFYLMEKEGVVVPGEPEQSELMEHLLSPGMQMPPSTPPLPDEQIQLIVSWIAQGAKDN